ncbi:MAG: hypothetical protein OQK51_12730 [Kangiellaceae bacterium]|nr:hypothetical protein [Kangiellaceae bacterium]
MPTKPITRYHKLSLENESVSVQKLNILISGFGLQRVIPVDDIVKALTSLPTDHIKRLKVVKFDPAKNISFLLRHQRVGPQIGEYLTSFESVVIYKFKDKPEGMHVLFHEIGHHVYFKHITSQAKKKWVTKIYKDEPAVTTLGQKNACEDFAEAYALYKTRPEYLKTFAKKYYFIENLFIN